MTDLSNSESTDAVLVRTAEESTSPSGSDMLAGGTASLGTVGSGGRYLSRGLAFGASEGALMPGLHLWDSFLSANTGAVTLLHLESEVESVERAQILKNFAEELNDEMIEQPPEAARVVEENFWDLF